MLTPGVSTYPAGQDSWLIYGPIDLGKFAYAHLSFEYYLNSRAGDTLLWGYSTDGQTFQGNSQSGPLGKWITNTLAIDTNLTEFKTVYLAFAFNSHTNPQGIGPFVRNVRLTGEPLKVVYLPSVMNNYSRRPCLARTPLMAATPTSIIGEEPITTLGRQSMDNVSPGNARSTRPLHTAIRATACACTRTERTIYRFITQ
jgi:hypothetical protein